VFDPRRRLEQYLGNHQGMPFEVVYWTGDRRHFGRGEPRFTLHFKTKDSLLRSLVQSSLGFGEAYASGDIVIDGDLEDVLVALSDIYLAIGRERLRDRLLKAVISRSLPKEKADIEHHYGLGNDFYRFYLDRQLQYSCAYFRSPQDSLDLAQEQKIAHTAAKLNLKPGQRLLDIGCGWGHLMFHAARTYGVECVGITLCDNQAAYIREESRRQRLPVDVRVMNYQELPAHETWDRVVSVGMMCHIGPERVEAYFDTVQRVTAPGGVCLLHFISKMQESLGVDPFVSKHIFPGYWFNSIEGVTSRSVRRGFHVLDVENLRRHYGLTAQHWRRNFLRNYDAIRQAMGFDDVFMRKWEFYLASVVAGFLTGQMHLIQIVLSRGVASDYPWTREFLYNNSEDARSESSVPLPA
jgi:cyclopropane-fatty-acyl-phospholipid synthase